MKLVLGPTDTAQWQQLILEAEQACAVNLTENTESYLVFLLMRFTEKPDIAASVLGLEFLQGAHDLTRARDEKLRDVGDKCLLYSGLFPGRAERRRVDVSYFVKLGQAAYATLSDHTPYHARSASALYDELGRRFVEMMEVLQTTRELSEENRTALTALQAYSLWEDVGSQHALTTLRRYTQGLIFPVDQKDKKH